MTQNNAMITQRKQAAWRLHGIALILRRAFTNTPHPSQYSMTSSAACCIQLTMKTICPGSIGTKANSDLTAHLQSLSFDNMNRTFDNFATSSNNHIRSVSDNFALSIPSHQVTVVSVKWRWLAPPGPLIGLALIFLIAAMPSSAQSRAMLWKGSSVATFYCALTSEGRDRLCAATGPTHLEESAEDLEVKRERTGK